MPRWNICLRVKVCDAFGGESTGSDRKALVAGSRNRKDKSDCAVNRLLEEQFSLPLRSGMLDIKGRV